MSDFPCVYAIKNNVSGKIYVGSTRYFHARWKSHSWYLNNGNHKNEHLQRSYNKYGKDAFTHYAIEKCEPDKLEEREQYWIDELLRCRIELYNTCLKVQESLTEARLKKYAQHGNPLKGRKRDPELMAQIHAKLAEGFASGRLHGGMYGKKQSEEHKRKIREATTGKPHIITEEGFKAQDESRRKLTPARLAHIARLAALARERKIKKDQDKLIQ
jgi:group I intron endonuclease